MDITLVGPVALGRMRGTVERVSRTARDVAVDGRDDYCLVINQGATMSGTLARRDFELPGGAAVLMPNGDSGSIVRPATGGHDDWLNVIVPGQLLRSVLNNPDDLVARGTPVGSEALSLLAGYAELLQKHGAIELPDLLQHATHTLLDLMALALGTKGEKEEIANARGLRAARLQAVIGQIDRRFTEVGFSTRDIATALGISTRYVNDILYESGLGFSDRVLELRLQRARAMLADRRNDGMRVSDIAYASGFADISHFNRNFRRRFGTDADRRALDVVRIRGAPLGQLHSGGGMTTFAFSSASLPDHLDDRQRFNLWRDMFTAQFGSFDFGISEQFPFAATTKFWSAGHLVFARCSGTLERATRSARKDAFDGGDQYGLIINLGATISGKAARRDYELPGGGAMLMPYSEPALIFRPVTSVNDSWLNVAIPGSLLRSAVGNPDDLVVRGTPVGSEALNLLLGYTHLLQQHGTVARPDLLTHATCTLLDLIALALGASGEKEEIASARGLRAARLQAVLGQIAAEICRGGVFDPRCRRLAWHFGALRERHSIRKRARLFRSRSQAAFAARPRHAGGPPQ